MQKLWLEKLSWNFRGLETATWTKQKKPHNQKKGNYKGKYLSEAENLFERKKLAVNASLLQENSTEKGLKNWGITRE